MSILYDRMRDNGYVVITSHFSIYGFYPRSAASSTPLPRSNYVGVMRSKTDNNLWKVRIARGGKEAKLGDFILEADTALAYDEAVKQLGEIKMGRSRINFANLKNYEEAKQRELANKGLDNNMGMAHSAVKAKVMEFVATKFPTLCKNGNESEFEDDGVSTSDEEDEDDSRSPEDRAGRLTNITEPGPHDCLFGRGRGTSEHPGNIRFRKMIDSKKEKYVSSQRSDKPLVIMEIMDDWRSLDPPGRFLKQDGETDYWNDVGDEKAKQKATDAMYSAVRKTTHGRNQSNDEEVPSSDEEDEDDSSDSDDVNVSASSTKTSNYTGVSYHRNNKKWQAAIHQKKQIGLGSSYDLQCDAALAYDKAAVQLRGPNAKTNFSTLNEYKRAKKAELESTGLGMDAAMSPATIGAKVNMFLTKASNTSTALAGTDTEEEESEKEMVEEESNFGSDEEDSSYAGDVKMSGINKQSSIYTGVCYCKQNKKWQAYITNKKQIALGSSYNLQCDAALAYDKAAIQLRGPNTNTNFRSLSEYTKAKKAELESNGLVMNVAMTPATIEAKVNEMLRKASSTSSAAASGTTDTREGAIRGDASGKRENIKEKNPVEAKGSEAMLTNCPELAALNEAMEKKWASHLPSIEGDFLAGYQNNISYILKELKQKNGKDVCGNTASNGDSDVAQLTARDNGNSDDGAEKPSAAKQKVNDNTTKLDENLKPHAKTTYPSTNASAALRLNLLGDLLSSTQRAAKQSDRYRMQQSLGPFADNAQIDQAAAEMNATYSQKLSMETKPSEHQPSSTAAASQQNRTAHEGNNLPTHQSQRQSSITATRQLSKETNQRNDHRDDPTASHQRQSLTAAAAVLSTTATVSTARPTKKQPHLTKLQAYQVDELDLPYSVGCTVCFQFDKVDNSNSAEGESGDGATGQTFHTGVVAGVYMDFSTVAVFYQVKHVDDYNTTQRSAMFSGSQLCYAPRCPVNITLMSSGNDDSTSSTVHAGEVLVSRAKSSVDMVLQLKVALLNEQIGNNNDNNHLLAILDQLDKIPMSRKILAKTYVGKAAKKLVKSHDADSAVAKTARKLVEKWKEIAIAQKHNQTNDSGTGGDNDAQDDDFVFLYTILIHRERNQFMVEENVLSDRVKYRHVAGLKGEHESSNSTITTAITGLY